MIKHLFQNELEENNYAKIQDLYDKRQSEYPKARGEDDRGRKNDRYGRKRDYKDREERNRNFKDRDGKKKEFKEDKGKIRMFLSLGKKDDLSPKGLLKMLNKKTKIEPEKVSGIQISESYSFFNVPKKEADSIIEKMNKGKNDRPLVEKAKS